MPERRYIQVVEAIRADIENGILKPGDKIPSERELAATFGIARPTVSRALRELHQAGLVTPKVGVGNFVVFDADTATHLRTFEPDELLPVWFRNRTIEQIKAVAYPQGRSVTMWVRDVVDEALDGLE